MSDAGALDWRAAAATGPSTDTPRVADLRCRVRSAMARPPVAWGCPQAIAAEQFGESIPVRKARAIALKLAHMPTELWAGQIFAGSMTLEEPRLHCEWGFPEYVTPAEKEAGAQKGQGTWCFGHIVPDYPKLLAVGLRGIGDEARAQYPKCQTDGEKAFLDSVIIATEGVIAFAQRLALACEAVASQPRNEGTAANAAAVVPGRADELREMAANLRQVPAGPARTFWQALQSVWLLHMIFHSTMDGNALGRLDQYAWPYLQADLAAGRCDLAAAAELVDCFCLKFNERAKATDEQLPEARRPEPPADGPKKTRHSTSSQIGTNRDGLDATNHWLQNIVIGGLTPDGADGTNPLSFLLLESYRRHKMTNPLLAVRVHGGTPPELLRQACVVLREGGGMPAIFNDEAVVPALERIGIPTPDARDYTNDGCWEIIIPGRTDFCFQRLSLMLCLEWALRTGVMVERGIDTGDPRRFGSFEEMWRAFAGQVDAMVGGAVAVISRNLDNRSVLAPVPLLSALIDGAIRMRRDMTCGGAKFRTYALLAEAAAHAIDSLAAIKTVIFEQRQATMAELCDALANDFRGHEPLRRLLLAAPKYGNDDERADAVGRDVIALFTETVARHGAAHEARVKFPCGVGTFSWYIGIGEGLGASPDGRLAGLPVSSNFSPALGRDVEGIPGAILSYAKMHHCNLPAGAPLDLRLAKRLVGGEAGLERMAGLVRGFVDTGGTIMTLTVADAEELRAAQAEPEKYASLRVRMGGWCAYFTMLSREAQEHHIQRQGGAPLGSTGFQPVPVPRTPKPEGHA